MKNKGFILDLGLVEDFRKMLGRGGSYIDVKGRVFWEQSDKIVTIL